MSTTAHPPKRPTFAARLKQARHARGMLQKDVAHPLGLTPASICEMEHGRQECTHATMRKLCGLLEVSADWLLGITKEGGPVL